ncbi:MAG: FAD-dependent oxidoreductase [Rhodobacteraceae bacterium]|nr:FAD-dependent oxidoreductase [Paracoccaceae bacterium]
MTPSLWHVVSGAVAARPPLDVAEVEADLLVIGAGFTGLSCALHAATAGLRVVVVEADRIAAGASGRNAGFVVPNFARVDPDAVLARLGPDRGARLVGFAAASADLVFGLIRDHAIACDALQSGWIQPAPTEAAMQAIRARARQWADRGRPVAVLDAGQVAHMTGARGYAGGWIDHSGGVLNPVAYARGLAAAAERAGAVVFEDTPVTSLHAAPGGWIARSGAGSVRAARVVLATNAHIGGLQPAVARSFFPLRVYQIATAPLPAAVRTRLLPGGQCVSDTRRNLFTFRFDANNRLISGGMHILGPGADYRVPRAIHRRLSRLLDLPDLPPLEHAWSGQAAVMPDFLPHLIEPAPGLMAGIACNGRGIAMTTMLGRVLADWAGGVPAADLPVPSGPPAPIPWHGLMRYAPNAHLPLAMLRDALDARGE